MVRVALHSASRLPFPPSSSPTTPLTHNTTTRTATNVEASGRSCGCSLRSRSVTSRSSGGTRGRCQGNASCSRCSWSAVLCCIVLCWKRDHVNDDDRSINQQDTHTRPPACPCPPLSPAVA